MKVMYFVFAFLLFYPLDDLHATCFPEGKIVSCTSGGKKGTKTCESGRFTACEVEKDTPPPVTGTVAPRYYILAVIYAPPGTQGGGSSSSVSYGSGSTTGTTVSASNSFKQNYSLTAAASVDILGISPKIGLSFGYGHNSTNTSALDIKKSTNSVINAVGPGVDGIDHERDQIWLWLNPKIKMTMTPTSASWTLQDGQRADIQFVFVGHLKDPSRMPQGVIQRLQTYGITPQDFPEILRADPFANGDVPINPARYQSLHTTFPYEPPFAQGDPVTTLKTTISNSTASSSSSSAQNDITVGLSITGEKGFLSIVKASLKTESSWTWTCTSTTGASTNITESAEITVGGPAFGYTGPTDMAVYYDVLYKTFLFAPVTGPVEFKGALTSRSGKKVSGQEVIVIASGKRYRTFTNARGQFRIPERITGPAELKVGIVNKRVTQPGAKVDITMP